jgi:sugar lactone lactonase YvrE
VAVDANGNLFVADWYNLRIRKIAADTGVISTVAGNGTNGLSGDGGPATEATLGYPTGMTLDALGNLFIVDWGNNRIRRVAATTGVITTVAGTGRLEFSGDNGPATAAGLCNPDGAAVDSNANLFIADTRHNRVRIVRGPLP